MRQTKKKKESSSGEIDLEKYQTNASRKQLANESYLPPEIRSEQLSRNMLYFGSNGMQSITNASVLVVGLGGVGSHAAHMLARSGVKYLRLIDFDQVTLSSLNRHACATLEDVGIPKVIALKRFLHKVCPDRNFLDIDALPRMYTGTEKDGDMMDFPAGKVSGLQLDKANWDFIIDAIDDVPTKAKLLAHCIRNNIRVVSCMGAGGKSDATRIHISDLRTACQDPLATKLRQTLKKSLKNDSSIKNESYMEDMDKVAVIYSSEKTVVKLVDFTPEQKEEGIHKFGAVDNMRIRVLPVLGTMPAIMGQSMAAMVLCELGGKPFSPMSGERIGRNLRHRLFQHLKNREKAIRNSVEEDIVDDQLHNEDKKHNDDIMVPRIIKGKWIGPVQIDADDVEYMLTEIWRNRCCVSGQRLGTVLELARWDLSKPSNCQNLVLLGVKAMQQFDKDGRDSIPVDIRRKVEERLKSCRIDSRM